MKKLESKKRGRPFLLGNLLDEQVQSYVLALRDAGAVINTAIVMAEATGIVQNHNSRLLKCNGGHIEITKYWALSLLERMGYVKRKSSTKAKVTPSLISMRRKNSIFLI